MGKPGAEKPFLREPLTFPVQGESDRMEPRCVVARGFDVNWPLRGELAGAPLRRFAEIVGTLWRAMRLERHIGRELVAADHCFSEASTEAQRCIRAHTGELEKIDIAPLREESFRGALPDDAVGAGLGEDIAILRHRRADPSCDPHAHETLDGERP